MIPRSLVVLAAVGFAASAKVEGPTPKRELLEGNHGQQKRQELAKDVSPGIVYAKDYSEDLPELPPGHEVFGARSPPISTISDLLAGAGTPFELAVANHLSSPYSIYQTRLASPPFRLATQQSFQAAQAYNNQKITDKTRNQPKPNPIIQDIPNSAKNELPQTALTKLDFIAIGRQNQNPDLGRPRGFSLQNTEPRAKPTQTELSRPQFFPIEPQGPFKRPGHFIPAQYLQQQSVYQLVPLQQNPIYQEQRKLEELAQNPQQLQPVANEKPQSQNLGGIPQPGYHNHPNGAISFASYTNNQHQQSSLAQQQIQRQPIKYINLQPSQQGRLQEQPQPQNYNQQPQNFQQQIPSNYYQFIPQNEPQSELLSSQPSLSFQPRYFNQQQLFFNPGFPVLQSIPEFKPLPQSIFPNNQRDISPKRLPEQNSRALNPQNTNQDSVSHQTSTVSERSITHTKSIQPLSYNGFLPTTLKPNNAKTNQVITTTINFTEIPKEEPTQISEEDQLLRVQPLQRNTQNQNESSPHVTPRHLVTIQKQELREITLPTFRPVKYARVLHAQDLLQHNQPKELRQENLIKTNERNIHEIQNTQQTQVYINQQTNIRQNSTELAKDSENSQTEVNPQEPSEFSSEKPKALLDTESKVKPIQLLYKLLQEQEILNQNKSQNAENIPINSEQDLPSGELSQFFTQTQELSQQQLPEQQLPQQQLLQEQLTYENLPQQQQLSEQLTFEQLPQQQLPYQELPQQQLSQPEVPRQLPQQQFSSFGLPEYQSVQYFGKYAQSLFGDYPH